MYIGVARIDELRWQQLKTATSAADALYVQTDAVPNGKIWTVTALSYYASAAETRNLLWGKVSRVNGFMAGGPAAQRSVSAVPWENGFIDPADTVILFPGERLRVKRDVATAGSTMTIDYQIIESDEHFPQYVDPLKPVVKRRRGSLLNRAIGGASGGSLGGGGEAGSGFGGEPGPSEPLV